MYPTSCTATLSGCNIQTCSREAMWLRRRPPKAHAASRPTTTRAPTRGAPARPSAATPPPAPRGRAARKERRRAACSTVAIAGLPRGTFDLHLELRLSLPPALVAAEPTMCSVRLLSRNSSEHLAAASRAALLPDEHWMIRLWSAAIWGPFITLGLVRDQKVLAVPLLEQVRLSEEQVQSVSQAEVCLRPPLAVYQAELRIYLRLGGPLVLLQRFPWLCSLMLVLIVGGVAWVSAGFCGFALALLLWGPSPQKEGEPRFVQPEEKATARSQRAAPLSPRRPGRGHESVEDGPLRECCKTQ
mmetsp:Transcript_118197/g.378675  ORF Transcript_118197/g.378675 Transcript_118197/m.378675 type:complete len:300 (-) Transcript_118197:64-963(-)